MSEAELAAVQNLQWFWEHMGAFSRLQAQQPQTLAHALADSPAGLAGWNGQLFGEDVDLDFVLTNITIYWLTRTTASSGRL
jgi:hypothetical protein